jgi:hypothetical protein
MNIIYKYPINYNETVIEMPGRGHILDVQTVNNQPYIWVWVDNETPKVTRKFVIYGTGHPMPPYPGEYIGTFQQAEGALIWHLFEIT